MPASGADSGTPSLEVALGKARTQAGESLLEVTGRAPTLILFLRHFGCTFCKENLSDAARLRPSLDAAGTQLAFVHLGTEAEAAEFMKTYGFQDLPRVSDPEMRLYRAFMLRRFRWWQLFDVGTWIRGWQSLKSGNRQGKAVGDPLQLSGAFLVSGGRILGSFRQNVASDRPDLESLAACPIPQAGNPLR